jgi:hypothetical protein
MKEIIKVKVIKTIYRKEDSKWSIIRTDKGTVKGVVSWDVKDNDLLKLEGEWKRSSFNGSDEFIFRTAMPDLPDNNRALLTYAVAITNGLGAATEEKIWLKYGENWKTTYTLDIPGVKEATQFHWQDTLKRLEYDAAKSEAIAFLLGKGATLNMSAVAWETWTKDTTAKVNENPFILAELPRYGFSDVDQGIRQAFGIGEEDWRRMDAAILYCLARATDCGNTAVQITELVEAFGKFAKGEGAAKKFENSIERLKARNKITQIGEFISDVEDFGNEEMIFERFAA